jgi:pyrroloquinoline quinone (PQQ) biosynthesis protein C
MHYTACGISQWLRDLERILRPTTTTLGEPSIRLHTAKMSNLDQAFAFLAIVHNEQKRKGLWLAQHPFVQAVRIGSARRDEIQRWVRETYAITRTYSELLESRVQEQELPTEMLRSAQRDLDLLLRFGEALGVAPGVLLTSQRGPAAKRLEAWIRERMAAPNDRTTGQICWHLMMAMSPEAGDCLAEGFETHFGCDDEQIQYFTVGMKSNANADEYAAKMLCTIASDKWATVLKDTLFVSRLVTGLYDSAGDMWSSW